MADEHAIVIECEVMLLMSSGIPTTPDQWRPADCARTARFLDIQQWLSDQMNIDTSDIHIIGTAVIENSGPGFNKCTQHEEIAGSSRSGDHARSRYKAINPNLFESQICRTAISSISSSHLRSRPAGSGYHQSPWIWLCDLWLRDSWLD